jgi:hypothetical protein
LEANQAVSFFVKLQLFGAAVTVQSQTLDNGQTLEKLVIKGATGIYDSTTISRYTIGTNEEEWDKEISQHQNIGHREILFDA